MFSAHLDSDIVISMNLLTLMCCEHLVLMSRVIAFIEKQSEVCNMTQAM